MSRAITDLQPPMLQRVEQLLRLVVSCDFDLLIYCTRRSFEEQAALFRQGRSLAEIRDKARELDLDWGRDDLAQILLDCPAQTSRAIVTHAGPGQSLHNYGLAIDAVPMRNGKPVWGTREPDDYQLWHRYGEMVRNVGLVWAGDWQSFREFPHAQLNHFAWQDLISEPML